MKSSFVLKSVAAAALIGAVVLVVAPARADDSGYYLRAYVGATGLGTDDLTLTENGTTSAANADFAASFTGGGSFGYRYNENVRVEAEIAYRSADNDEVAFTDGRVYTDGNFASLTIGITGFYDFQNNTQWTPFVGAGAAWIQEVDIDFEDDSGEISYEGDDFGFVVAGGVRWDPSGAPWFVDGEVRYLGVGDVDLGNDELNGTVTADYNPWSVNVTLGLRF